MNWVQLYALATPEERNQLTLHMLGAIEARNNKLVIANGRLIRNRRGAFPGAHFLNDKRKSFHPFPEAHLLIGAALNLGLWCLSLPVVPHVAAPIVALNLLGLALLFLPGRVSTAAA